MFPKENLLAFWKLDNLTDSRGNRYTLTNNGSVQFVAGKIGNCSVINGNHLSSNFSLNTSSGNDWSISVWLKRSSFTGLPTVIDLANNVGGHPILDVRNADEINFNDGIGELTSATFNPDTWTHIVLSSTNGVVSMYKNAVPIDTVNWVGTGSSSVLLIGVDGTESRFFNGFIDALGIWQKGLSLQEVQALYNNGNGLEPEGILFLEDSSTNNFQLSAFGNTAVNTTTFKYGGGSAYFDGDEDYIRGNQLFDYSSDFTIEGWVYRTSSGSISTIFEAGDIQGGQGGLHFYIDGDGIFVLNDGFSPDFQGGTATLNEWVHFAIVRNNNVNTLYINGTAVGSGTQTYPVNNDIFTIGGAPNYSFYFQGYLDDFRITSGIARYTSNFTPPAQQLLDPLDPHGDKVSLLLHMDGADGSTTFIDSSTNNFALTAYGDAEIDTTTKKFGSGAALFDGGEDYLEIAGNSTFDFYNTNYTVEMWVYSTASQSGGSLITTRLGGVYSPWELQITSSNKIGLLIQSNSNSWYEPFGGAPIEGNTTIPQNQWTHIAWVCNGANTTVYVNGVADSVLINLNTPILQAHSLPSNIYIGKGGDGAFNGYIDELRITKGIARYTTNFVPQTAPFANPNPWSNILNSTYANNIVAAYDFRDYNGSNSVTSKIGPNLETSNVTQVAEGLEFVKGYTSWAFANSTVACSYPFTMVFVAKTTNTSTNESTLINCSPTRFGSDILVFTRGSNQPPQGLMPYNGLDNQVTNYLPDGTEWYFYAVSFLNNGTVRYATRKASGNLNGTVNGDNGSTFNGYPGVAAGFGSESGYGTSGKFRLALFINQAFSTEAQMDYLFNTILSGPASDLALQ
jgi:hypothetical protein